MSFKLNPTEALKAADHLNKAAGLIDAGWIQGQPYADSPNGNRHYCAMGAIEATVTRITPLGNIICSWGEYHTAIQSLRELGNLKGSIAIWNDDPRRTQAQVSKKMRSVARKLRRMASEESQI